MLTDNDRAAMKDAIKSTVEEFGDVTLHGLHFYFRIPVEEPCIKELLQEMDEEGTIRYAYEVVSPIVMGDEEGPLIG